MEVLSVHRPDGSEGWKCQSREVLKGKLWRVRKSEKYMRFLGIVKGSIEVGDHKCIVVYFLLLNVFL